jgi:DNA-directed RNA polymerase subunit H (RpoH/RPB5)
MDSDTLDLIVRSRPTILEILENRGYNMDAYKRISPEEIYTLAISSQALLKIAAPKKEDSEAPLDRVIVLYWVEGAIKQKLDSEVRKLWDEENPEHYDPEHDELVIILSEPPHDAFHLKAIKEWGAHKARISFFALKNLIFNPARHIMVPPHRKLTADEGKELLSAMNADSKQRMPHIKFHTDMMARVLGLVPGDLVEITRSSETCGEYTTYRVCVV